MGEINYDLIIEPNGLTAALSALAFQRSGFKVAFAQHLPKAAKLPESAYVSLNHNSLELLKMMGISPKRSSKFNAIHVEMNHEPLVFTASDLFQQSLATVLPLNEIATACYAQIANTPVVPTEGGWKQQAKYLLKTKKAASIPALELPHHVSTALIHAQLNPKTATQFFRFGEVFGILPTENEHQFALIHSASAPLTTEELNKKLKLIGINTTQIEAHQPYFKIQMYHIDQYVQQREIGIHHACHMVHPMAGFGLNMGLSDLACLLNTFPHNLTEYRSICLQKNMRSVLTIQQLFAAYCEKHICQELLDVGVRIVNDQKLLKKFLMTQAQSV